MKTTWFQAAIVIGLAILSSLSFGYSGGDGTSGNPYQIADANDLLYLAGHTDDYTDYFVMTADIDLAGYTFNAALIAPDTGGIGGESFEGVAFKGVFDGGNHVIRNYRIEDLAGADYLGLFGYAQNAVIKNLGLEDAAIVALGYDYQSVSRGGLVGLQESGTIENCWCTVSMQGGRYRIGGIVGFVAGGSVRRCRSYAVININQWGSSNIGGVAGLLEGGTIENCSTGGSLVQGTGNTNMGGIVGLFINGIIRNCYSTCSVAADDRVGGLVGNMFSTAPVVEKCYSTGTVAGQTNTGGLIGMCTGTVTASFWNRQTSNQFSTSAGGTPLYTSQMKIRSTFTSAGWDFANETANGTSEVWRMCVDGLDYPRLNWESIDGDFACPDGVNVEDMNYFVGRWLLENCTSENNNCGGADMNISGVVSLADWTVFAQHWLEGID